MTREEKIEAFTMRLDGYTLKEIGDRFGITREAVRSMFSRITTQSVIVKKQYVYPNIAKWMIENNLNQSHSETVPEHWFVICDACGYRVGPYNDSAHATARWNHG